MFRLNRNERSHWSGNGVHVESELVFMIGRNMQLTGLQARLVMTIVLMKNNRMFKVNRVFCFPIETKAPIR